MADSSTGGLPDDPKRKVAYFSMEVGLQNDIPTYSGGLGVLAGDTIKSAADLRVPMVAVTLLYRHGYFKQKLGPDGTQSEEYEMWEIPSHMKLLDPRVEIWLEGRRIVVQAWEKTVVGVDGFHLPVIYLDTDHPENDQNDKQLSGSLYSGDTRWRFLQEAVLGIAGVRMLRALGYNDLERFHMNEGHAALLVTEIGKEVGILPEHQSPTDEQFQALREQCVFTTHTPVPAGHDRFHMDLVRGVMGDQLCHALLADSIEESGELNMTLLALNHSHYINGVARKHGEVSRCLFPGYPIQSITNGVHHTSWTAEEFQELFDKYLPEWRSDPFVLRNSMAIPREEIWDCHMQLKNKLLDWVNQKQGSDLSSEIFTIGFARRAATYKRSTLFFRDLERLKKIAAKYPVQMIVAGKSHPNDGGGKDLIRQIFHMIEELKGSMKVVFIEDYNIATASMLTSGVDVWMNTPIRLREASGTSGMKAVLNGVPNFSILDGWWIEGHIEGVTGWAIGPVKANTDDEEAMNNDDARNLYEKLESVILPLFYNDREAWTDIMRYNITFNGSFFNTHRMVQQYVLNAYFS